MDIPWTCVHTFAQESLDHVHELDQARILFMWLHDILEHYLGAHASCMEMGFFCILGLDI